MSKKFNKEVVRMQSEKFDSFYLYDESKIVEYTNRLKEDFQGVTFLYSIKANSNPSVVKAVLSQGFGADAASLEEVRVAQRNGITADKIHFSAPGKLNSDIESAIDISTLVCDSLGEIDRVNSVAEAKGIQVKIGVRINPNFSLYGNCGLPSKFGIDEQQIINAIPYINQLRNVEIIGMHIHLRSQELDFKLLEEYYEKILDLTVIFQNALGHDLHFVNMGSGIGLPYAQDDKALDTETLGKVTKELISNFKLKAPDIKVFIESGRYVVGKCGVYVTKVLDKKTSFGTTYVILNNTLNGFIRPSIAQLVMTYSSNESPAGSEPLFTAKNAFEIIPLTDEKETETVTLVGNLCTATDVVAKSIEVPILKCGDSVVITNAGSYAAVLSPKQFSSQVIPAELFLSVDGKVINT